MTAAGRAGVRWPSWLVVGLGSALGGLARAGLSLFAIDQLGAALPWGTLACNVIGSMAIGGYATLTGPDGRLVVGMHQRHFVMTGFCGGFTTFSVFSLETLQLALDGAALRAGLYVGLSLVTWITAAWAGSRLAASIMRPRRA